MFSVLIDLFILTFVFAIGISENTKEYKEKRDK